MAEDTVATETTLLASLVTDPGAGGLTYQVAGGANGAVTTVDAATGALTYRPPQDFAGTDQLTFRVTDATNAVSNAGVVTITVSPVNDAPDVTALAIAAISGGKKSGQCQATDPDSAGVVFRTGIQPTKGQLTWVDAATGAFCYQANAEASGTDTFTVIANDGQTDSAPATVTVTLVPLTLTCTPRTTAHTGEVIDLTATAPGIQGMEYRFYTAYRTSNTTWSDLDYLTGYGPAMSATWTPPEAHHYTVVVQAREVGSTAYADVYTYAMQAVLPAGFVDLQLAVTPPSPTPLETPLTLQATPVGIFTGDLEYEFLVQHALPSGGWSAVEIIGGQAETGYYTTSAERTWLPDGVHTDNLIVYIRMAGSADDLLRWQSVQQTVTPGVAPQSYSTLEDTPLLATSGLLQGAVGLEAMTQRAVAVALPSHGTLYQVLNGVKGGTVTAGELLTDPAGMFVYEPAADYAGSDSFTYRAQDSTGAQSNTATVTLTVTAVNDAPSFTKGVDQTVDEDAPAQTVTAWATGITAGPVDERTQSLDFLVTTTNSTLFSIGPTIDAQGTLTYTPAPNANGSAVVTVRLHDAGGTASDGADTSAPQTFTITVTAANDPPLAIDQPGVVVPEDSKAGIGIALSGVHLDADQVLTYQVCGGPIHGKLVGDAPNLTYLPLPNYSGRDTFTFSVSDGIASDTGVVTVTVTPVNDAPAITLTSPVTTGVYAAPATVTLTADAHDIDGRVTGVTFYLGAQELSTDTTYPFTYVCGALPQGHYTFRADATDDGQATTQSSVVEIDVVMPSAAPVLTNLVVPSSAVTPSVTLKVTAMGTDLQRVEFCAGSAVIGVGTNLSADPPNIYTYVWDNVQPGVYSSIFAKGYDAQGNVGVSQVAGNLTVTNPVPIRTYFDVLGKTYVPSRYYYEVTLPATMRVTASDPNGTVSRVEFYMRDSADPASKRKLGEGSLTTAGDFEYTWSTSIPDTGVWLSAVVYDNEGATAPQTGELYVVPHMPQRLTVTGACTGGRGDYWVEGFGYATFYHPGDTAVFTADVRGPSDIAGVEFLANGRAIGAGTYTGDVVIQGIAYRHYEYEWSGLIPGRYRTSVVATDVEGRSARYDMKDGYSIGDPIVVPAIQILTPADGDSYGSAPANLTVTAKASPAYLNGCVIKLRGDGVELGTGTTGTWNVSTLSLTSTWVGLQAGVHRLTAEVSQGGTVLATSAPVYVYVATNAPTVTLEAPTALSFPAVSPIGLSATVTGDNIEGVDFLVGGATIGSDNAGVNGVYTCAWTTVRPGVFELRARVRTMNGGPTATSAVKTITVGGTGPSIESITLSPQSPAIGPTNVTISAAVTPSTDVPVRKVEFFHWNAKLGETLSAPYVFTWSGVAPGTYPLTVVATDAEGMTATQTTNLSVTEALPTVSLQVPSSVALPDAVPITVDLSDGGSGVSKVEIIVGGKVVGTVQNPEDFIYYWEQRVPGSYSVSARIYDAAGGCTLSPPVSVNLASAPLGIAIQSPTSEQVIREGSDVAITPVVTESQGRSARRVKFFDQPEGQPTTEIGEDPNGSDGFAWNWPNVPAGRHTLTAKMYDDLGMIVESAPVVVFVNAPPVLSPASSQLTVTEDASGTIDMTITDAYYPTTGIDSATCEIVSQPSHGWAVPYRQGGGLWRVLYTPRAHWFGADTFCVVANDGYASSNTVDISVIVTNASGQTVPYGKTIPIAYDQAVLCGEDMTMPITLTADYGSLESTGITYRVARLPEHGALVGLDAAQNVVSPMHKISYQPTADWTGTDRFTFVVSGTMDMDGLKTVESLEATVTITVEAMNDAPSASPLSVEGMVGVGKTIYLSGEDKDGDPLTFTIVTPPATGTLSAITSVDNVTGAVTYTSDTATDAVTFTYQVSDGSSDSVPATVTVKVYATNQPPAVADDYTVDGWQDEPLSIGLLGDDVSGNVTYSIEQSPTNGTLGAIDQASHVVEFTPAPGWVGTTTLQYRAHDGTEESVRIATVTINIQATAAPPVNTPPATSGAYGSTNEGVAVTFALPATDSDAGDVLTYTLVTLPRHGTAAIADRKVGQATYTPDAYWSGGTDRFTYRVTDSSGAYVDGTAEVDVQPVGQYPDVPVATDIEITIEAGASECCYLSASTYSGEEALSYWIVTPPANGVVTPYVTDRDSEDYGLVQSDIAEVWYTPLSSTWYGTDSFTYMAMNGDIGGIVGTVIVTVQAPALPSGQDDHPPTAANIVVGTDEDHPITIVLAGSDAEGASLTYALGSDEESIYGTRRLAGAVVKYTPKPNISGVDTFTYRVSDGAAWSEYATVQVTVADVQHAPVAYGQSIAAIVGMPTQIRLAGSDGDETGEPDIEYDMTSEPAAGTCVKTSRNVITYTAPDYTGTYYMSFTAFDGTQTSPPATVTITVIQDDKVGLHLYGEDPLSGAWVERGSLVGGAVRVALMVRVDPNETPRSIPASLRCHIEEATAVHGPQRLYWDATLSDWECAFSPTATDWTPASYPANLRNGNQRIYYRATVTWWTTGRKADGTLVPLGYGSGGQGSLRDHNEAYTIALTDALTFVPEGGADVSVVPTTVSCRVRNIAFTPGSIVSSNDNVEFQQDYIKYDPNSADENRRRPWIEFSFEDDGDPHEYTYTVYLRRTGQEAWNQALHPFIESRGTVRPGTHRVTWDGAMTPDGVPDSCKAGIYTFTVEIREVVTVDGVQEDIDYAALKDGSLSVAEHEVWQEQSAGRASLHCSYYLNDQSALPAGFVKLIPIDANLDEDQGAPIDQGDNKCPFVRYDGTNEAGGTAVVEKDDPTGRGLDGWRIVFVGQESAVSGLMRRDHRAERMLAVNAAPRVAFLYLFFKNIDDDFRCIFFQIVMEDVKTNWSTWAEGGEIAVYTGKDQEKMYTDKEINNGQQISLSLTQEQYARVWNWVWEGVCRGRDQVTLAELRGANNGQSCDCRQFIANMLLANIYIADDMGWRNVVEAFWLNQGNKAYQSDNYPVDMQTSCRLSKYKRGKLFNNQPPAPGIYLMWHLLNGFVDPTIGVSDDDKEDRTWRQRTGRLGTP